MNSDETASLHEVLNEARDIVLPLGNVLPTWNQKIATLLRESANQRLRIGVVGVTSSGKSTFINALLGEALLPEQSKATTSLPVICRKGNQRRLLVAYLDDSTAMHTDDSVTADLVASLCSEDGNPGNVKNIARIELETPGCCLPPELEVIDTPGTDAYGFGSHETITLYKCLPLADIVVFMTQLRRRIAASDANLLTKVMENDQRILFVISSSDIEVDDHENGVLIRRKEDKILNHIGELKNFLQGFPQLKHSGVVAVSSAWAKEAGGDQSANSWRDSNFETILSYFGQYLADLSSYLTRARVERARAFLVSFGLSIRPEIPGIKKQTGQTSQESDLEIAVSDLEKAERSVREHVAALKVAWSETMNAQGGIQEMSKELERLDSSDIAGAGRIVRRFGERRKEQSTACLQRLDDTRSKCRDVLKAVEVTPNRRSLGNRVLHVQDVPLVSDRIIGRTETYSVPVPRTGILGRIADFFAGVPTEERRRTVSYVNLPLLIKDLEEFLKASEQEFSSFLKDQVNVLTELYLAPVQALRKERAQSLAELANLRAMAEKQIEALPGICDRLHMLALRLPLSHEPSEAIKPVPSALSHAPRTAPAHASTLTTPMLAQMALLGILNRAWEAVAVRRFWKVSSTAGSLNQNRRLDNILLVNLDRRGASELIKFLERGRTESRELGWDEGITLPHPDGETHLSIIPTDRPVSDYYFRERCSRATAVAVRFEAGQPSSGLNRMLSHPQFCILREFSEKVFFVFGDSAIYDNRLHDLAVELVPIVAKETGFSNSPWYLYEAARYDARYSDFIDIALRVLRSGGTSRTFLREWQAAELSMRPPFHQEALERAYSKMIEAEANKAYVRE